MSDQVIDISNLLKLQKIAEEYKSLSEEEKTIFWETLGVPAISLASLDLGNEHNFDFQPY